MPLVVPKSNAFPDCLRICSQRAAHLARTTGIYIHLKEYRSCIALMVFDKILQKLLIEVQSMLAEEEDAESENFCVWSELQKQIKKIKEDSRQFQCKCYAKK